MQKGVCFIIWGAILSSAFMYPPFLDGGYPVELNDEPIRFDWVLMISLGVILVATGIRWLAIPAGVNVAATIPLLIIGMALSESAVFFEIFLIHGDFLNEKALIYWLAIASMLQFCPLFIGTRQEPPPIKKFS